MDVQISVTAKNTVVTRSYAENHSIWSVEQEKRERKVLADAQRDIIEEAQKRVLEPLVIRG